MNKISFLNKHPIMSSIIATFLFLLVITVGGAVSSITSISSKTTLIIAFSVLAMILFTIINKTDRWDYYGFNSLNKIDSKDKKLLIPLLIFALLPLIAGFSVDLMFEDIIYIVIFMAIVSFVEETMFRGVIFRLLQKKSNMHAILGSCLLFSVPHMLNTLNGKAVPEAILQSLLAIIAGLILAMIMIKINNIIPLIIYHFINNTASSVTRTDLNASFELYFTLIFFVVGIVYAIYLYKLIQRDTPVSTVKTA